MLISLCSLLATFALAQDGPQYVPIGTGPVTPNLGGKGQCSPKPCLGILSGDWHIEPPWLQLRWDEQLADAGGLRFLRFELAERAGDVALFVDGRELLPEEASAESTAERTVWYVEATFADLELGVVNVGREDAFFALSYSGWSGIPAFE